MTEEEFLSEMQDILDCDNTLNMDLELNTIDGWESLAYVAFLAAMSDYTDKKIPASDVRGASTIRELYQLVQE